MPASDQEQIADSIKSSTFSGEVDAITSGIEERVRRAWQQRGYMEVRVSSHSEALNGDLTEKRLAVAFSVDEGRQYRLGGMVFKRAKLPIDEKSLRNLFPIQDGDIFNSAAVADGLQALSDIYRQIGYINFTSVPEMRFDDEAGTVWLDLDLDEGKQFRISTIGVIGLDQVASQQALRELLLRPGDIYNQELMETSIQKLSSSSFSVGSEKRILNEKAGTVAITVSFRHCGQ